MDRSEDPHLKISCFLFNCFPFYISFGEHLTINATRKPCSTMISTMCALVTLTYGKVMKPLGGPQYITLPVAIHARGGQRSWLFVRQQGSFLRCPSRVPVIPGHTHSWHTKTYSAANKCRDSTQSLHNEERYFKFITKLCNFPLLSKYKLIENIWTACSTFIQVDYLLNSFCKHMFCRIEWILESFQ